MHAVIESEIAELKQRIERREFAILHMETKFRDEEEDRCIALMDQEENEEAALRLVADLKKEHDRDKNLVLERTLLEREQLHLIALRQDREIYLFYLERNEEEEVSNIAYIRVSSDSQYLDRQEELFKGYKIDKFYMEKVSGKNIKDRPELQKMMDYVREGDIVYVESISRFGRSLQDLLNLINQLNEKGVQFKGSFSHHSYRRFDPFRSGMSLYLSALH